MLQQGGWFVLGALLLVLGGDSLVKGAAGLALGARLRPFLVGLFVVGLGTSLPELAVNLEALRIDRAGIALGNVVGSSIAHLGLVLGLAAVIAPFAVRLRLSAWLLPALLLLTLALGVLGFDQLLTRVDGLVLLALFVVALVVLVRQAGREPPAVQAVFADAAATRPGLGTALLRLIVGIAVTAYGSHLAVDAAGALATLWAWSDLLVGLSLVALGTLLPELVTAVMAARRGQGDLALGNALGGVLANLGLVLGITLLGKPLAMPRQLVQVELPILALFALALYPMLRGDAQLSRREGGVLLGAYLVFFAWEAWLAAG